MQIQHKTNHKRGEQSKRAKLTEENIREIRKLYFIFGMTQQEISKKYDVCQSTIANIITGRTWKHVK